MVTSAFAVPTAQSCDSGGLAAGTGVDNWPCVG